MLVLSILIPGAFGGGDIKFMVVSGFLLGKEKIICSMAMCDYACRRILPYYVEMWKADQKG